MKLPSKTLERKLLADYDYIIGVDEVGVGCLAGPVAACAIEFNRDFFAKEHEELIGVRDSKLLSAGQREKLVRVLQEKKDWRWRIAYCSSSIIDQINIQRAAGLAMRKAVNGLRPNSKTVVVIDGPHKIAGLSETLPQIPIIRGDQQVFAIACASILAKVFRDKMMIEYAKRYPGYGFEKHKGYGTKLHQAQLISLGPCAIHRRSFAPVAKLL